MKPCWIHLLPLWCLLSPSWGCQEASLAPAGSQEVAAEKSLENSHHILSPPRAPKVPTWPPKGVQMSSKTAPKSRLKFGWLPRSIFFNVFLDQFSAHVGGQNYEKTWEGSSKSSFADIWTRPSFRSNFGTIWGANWGQFAPKIAPKSDLKPGRVQMSAKLDFENPSHVFS